MSIPGQYTFRINAVYVKTVADLAEIAADKAASLAWSKGYNEFKENIRSHLKLQQTGRCAFCRCWVSVGTSFSNLEHIIGKTAYPQFEFLSENLVYCCTRCNLSKSKKNTLSVPIADKAAQLFPTVSEEFIIINPYYDDYESHIDFLDHVIIATVEGSAKGSNTISFYNLTRTDLAEDRAREFNLSHARLRDQLLARVTNPDTPVNALAQINDIIAQLPNWVVQL